MIYRIFNQTLLETNHIRKIKSKCESDLQNQFLMDSYNLHITLQNIIRVVSRSQESNVLKNKADGLIYRTKQHIKNVPSSKTRP